MGSRMYIKLSNTPPHVQPRLARGETKQTEGRDKYQISNAIGDRETWIQDLQQPRSDTKLKFKEKD